MSAHLAALRVLMAAFPKWDMPVDSIPVWLELLADVDPRHLRAAAVQLAQESKYPPTLAEWRERAASVAGGGRAGAIAPADAWAEVLRNRDLASRQRYESRADRVRPYTWSSPLIERAAAAIDWKGEWSGETQGTLRAQFERFLAQLVAKEGAIAAVQRSTATADRLVAPQPTRKELR